MVLDKNKHIEPANADGTIAISYTNTWRGRWARRIRGLINGTKGRDQDMSDIECSEPLYGDIESNRCPWCNGLMIEVNARTHKYACFNLECSQHEF